MKTFTEKQLRDLPPKFRHMAPVLRTVPADDITRCIIACTWCGFNDDQITEALRTLAEHLHKTEHRCSTCLAWVKSEDALKAGYVDSDSKFAMVAICGRCEKLLASGRATPTMHRNLMSYGLESEVVRR